LTRKCDTFVNSWVGPRGCSRFVGFIRICMVTARARPRLVVFAPIVWFGVVVAAKATGVDNFIVAMFR
jgi:hypothetical protein